MQPNDYIVSVRRLRPAEEVRLACVTTVWISRKRPPERLPMTDTISQVFDLPRQLDDRVRVSRPVRAVFHVASREEVNRWLLGKSGEAMTDQDLVLKYVVEVRDLSHDDEPCLSVEDLASDKRAAAMLAAVFLRNIEG